MYLLFDLSDKTKLRVCAFDTARVEWYEKDGVNRDLLLYVEDVISQEKKNADDVKGIAVVLGAGGFTSTRIAVTVANTFAFAKHIPVIGISLEEGQNPSTLVHRLESQPPGQLLSATYSGEPNIGKKNKRKDPIVPPVQSSP